MADAKREQVHNPSDDNGVTPASREMNIGGIERCLPLPDRVIPEADRLAAKGYTGANAPWRR